MGEGGHIYIHPLMVIKLLSFANNEQGIINQNDYKKNLLGQHINKNKSKELLGTLLGLLRSPKSHTLDITQTVCGVRKDFGRQDKAKSLLPLKSMVLAPGRAGVKCFPLSAEIGPLCSDLIFEHFSICSQTWDAAVEDKQSLEDCFTSMYDE